MQATGHTTIDGTDRLIVSSKVEGAVGPRPAR